jgi:hypothetical protein
MKPMILIVMMLIGVPVLFAACGSQTAQQAAATATPVPPTPAAVVEPAPIPADFDPARLVGGWGGEFNFEGDPQSNLMVAQFNVTDANQLHVDVGFPLLDGVSAVASPVNLSNQADMIKIQFAFPFTRTNNAAAILFDGEFEEGHIIGTIRQGDEIGTFELVPIAEFAPVGDESRT